MSDWLSGLGWICLEIGNGMSRGSLLCGYLVIMPSVRGIVGMDGRMYGKWWRGVEGLFVLSSCRGGGGGEGVWVV